MVSKENVNVFNKKIEMRTPGVMKSIVHQILQEGLGLPEKERYKKQKDMMSLHSAYPVNVIINYFFVWEQHDTIVNI